MGSGRGGLHRGTWGSREGEELRSRVDAVIKQFGASAVGDAAAELAETLVRIASGDSPEEALPEPGEVAFDLALDALSSFVLGGPAVTRELSLSAKSRKTASRTAKTSKVLIDDERGVLRARHTIRMGHTECAIVMENLNTYYHARLKGKKECAFPIGNYEYRIIPHDFADYEIIRRRELE